MQFPTSLAMMFVDRFAPTDVASKIAVSLGIGLLVGIEREWSNKDLGARTFALAALLGTAGSLFGSAMAIAALVGVFLIVLVANARSLLVDRSLEATTSTALLVIYVLGALAGQGHLFTPVASAILMTMLLAWKGELQRFAGGLQPEEIQSAVLLGLIGLVVYPVLPNRFIDRWDLINPREAWITVIVIAGIGFVNYVLLKVYGTRGVYVSGFLGGFVNSSAAALELARPVGAGAAGAGVALSAMLLTIIAMFVRNLIILAALSPSAVVSAAAPLIGMCLVALVFVRSASTHDEPARSELHLELPVSIRRVLSFGGLFLIIQILSTLGQRYLGKIGFLGVSMLGGLVSASTSAAAANIVTHGVMPAKVASEGVVLASVASALINLPILSRNVKNPALLKQLTLFTTITVAVGIAILILQGYVWSLAK